MTTDAPEPGIARAPREPVTVGGIVAAARALLVGGGVESVTVRELGRALQVTAPALYKHVGGRAEIVDLLTAACLDELTAEITAARDAADPADHRERLLAAALAWHRWAHAHPAEHALVFATPAVAFDRPETGDGATAGLRLGRAFLEIAVPAALAGALPAPDDREVPPAVAAQLRPWAGSRGLPLRDGQLLAVVQGFQDLMGLIMTASFGQLGFALADTDAYMRGRIEQLADALMGGDRQGPRAARP